MEEWEDSIVISQEELDQALAQVKSAPGGLLTPARDGAVTKGELAALACQIPVRVFVRSAICLKTIEEIAKLGPGDVLALWADPSGEFDLWVEDVLTARGKLSQLPDGNAALVVTTVYNKARGVVGGHGC